MTTQHTPGPWAVHHSHIYAPDGAIIAQLHNSGTKDADYPLVANRDLMAAAPDLLAALLEFVGAVDAGTTFADASVIDAARIAIAKARVQP